MELLASADLAQDHPTLVGGHREFFLRQFLGHFLPRRLSADRGIVYNFMGNSGECDVVIWDSANYPRLSMLDHSSFFVESVVCVVEVKSVYSRSEFETALARSEELRKLSIGGNASRFRHELEFLRAQALALEEGVPFGGISYSEPRVAYALVFLRGGSAVDLNKLFDEHSESLHDIAPDLVSFVDAGISIRKWEPDVSAWREGEQGVLQLTRPGEDVLISFADELLRIISLRSFGTDGLGELGAYNPAAFTWDEDQLEELPFRLTHFPAGYTFHREEEE